VNTVAPITAQSPSLVLRDIFFATVMRQPFFRGFTGRKCKMLQVQPQDLPYLGAYVVGEDMVPDGDANTGTIGFIHTLKIGFSVILQNNDGEIAETKLDQAFWTIMNSLWTDQYVTNLIDTMAYGHPEWQINPDNVRFEGVARGARRHLWGIPTGMNETPIIEMQYEVQVTHRSLFVPVIVDDLEHIHIETVLPEQDGSIPPAEQEQRIIREIDLTAEEIPDADSSR